MMNPLKKTSLSFKPVIIFFIFLLIPTLLSANKVSKLWEPYVGNKNADVTAYMFLALSCPSCKHEMKLLSEEFFNNKKYVSKGGAVKFVFISFAVHGKIDAMANSILYHTNNNKQFFQVAKFLFIHQSQWLNSSSPQATLIKLAKKAGMSNKQIRAYKNDTKTPAIILKQTHFFYKTYHVDQTPTLILVKKGRDLLGYRSKRVLKVTKKSLQDAIYQLTGIM